MGLNKQVAFVVKKHDMINRTLVQRRMEALGWTRQALAEATGIDPGNLHRILAGTQEPRVRAALALARCFRVRVEELFSEDHEGC